MCGINGHCYSFAHGYPVFQQHVFNHLPIVLFCHSFQRSFNNIYMNLLLNFLFCFNGLCLSFCLYHTVLIYLALHYVLKSGNVIYLNLCFSFEDSSSSSEYFDYTWILKLHFSIFMKNAIGKWLTLYWLGRSLWVACLWLYGSQQTVENSWRDGNTRSPDLPPEKSVCRSRSNS